MRLAAAPDHAAPPARSVHRQTRGRAPHRSARSPWRPPQAGPSEPSATHAKSPAPTARQAMSPTAPRQPGLPARRFPAPPWSVLRQTAAPRRCARRSPRRFRGQHSIAGQLLHHRLAGAFAEPIERQTRDVRATTPGRLEFGTKGDRQQHRQTRAPGRPSDPAIRARSGRSSGVFEYHQHRPAAALRLRAG